ncbi:type VI secretion system baseplate subunit TssF [Arvimicrobium flavum]|uniref:type VI secretion system baseplate subunit TssF n=1 Tax=Arvimicrobium flavum TaxID=3393320 RepID=UPI00237BC9A2|nr:type VI secretion system baseplate subunit TssF [Mesorhizobium shangrilense]
MNREFLESFEQELKFFYEHAKEYGEEFPGVADRLGGLTENTMDPGLQAVFQGSAFMAARVQLKLRSEFAEFTSALLDQLVPNYLAPIPSALLAEAAPPYNDKNLAEGRKFPAGSYLDAVYVERDRRVSCRYRLAAPLTVWPLQLEAAQYFATPAPLQTLGLETSAGTVAGLRLAFRRRTAKIEDNKPGAVDPGAPVNQLAIDTLPVHLVGSAVDTTALYEQLFANCRRITLRYLDTFGDARFVATPPEMLRQIGFEAEESLLGGDDRVFSGFALLRDFFVFPQKFIGFRLEKLRQTLASVSAPAFELLFEFDSVVPRLQSVVNPALFSLYSAPAANLFEMQCARVPVRRREHEHQVVPDRSRWLEYEVHRIVEIFAHYSGERDKVPVFPLYSLPSRNVPLENAIFHTARRVQRRETAQERRFGQRSAYVGTETFISLREPATIDDERRVHELSVRALVSNRHLTEHLPIGESGADFFLVDDTSLPLRCVAGPTPPRESIVTSQRRQRGAMPSGEVAWTLVNLLSLNHLGLTDRNPQDRAAGLKELLALFADLSDVVTERRIRGIQGISTRPIVRRIKQDNGFNAARGIEVTVLFDEKAFEGSGIMLLGAVLDRFFAEYSAINTFTETVIESQQRGIVKRWPPRSGLGRLL